MSRPVSRRASARAAALVGATLLLSRCGGDGVPDGPPEDIVRGFVIALGEHRFDDAIPYLSERMRAETIGATLSARIKVLEDSTGRLKNVSGVPQWTKGSRAYASADAATEKAGMLRLGFGLVQERNGAWRIDELYDLGWKPSDLK